MKRFLLSLIALAFLTCSAEAASRFWVGGTGTWDASDTSHWSASSGGASGASVPGSSDTVTFDGSSGGGTVTVNTNPTLSTTVPALTLGAFTGTLDFATNNNNISAGGVSLTGTGTRTLNMGSGTWTMTGVSGIIWNAITTTNLTFNAGTSTLLLSATATGTRQLFPFSQTLNNVTVTNAAQSIYLIDFQFSTVTFNNLTFTNCLQVTFPAAGTITISGTLTYAGSSTKIASLSFNNGSATNATMSVANAASLDWLLVRGITKAGAGSMTATNSFDGGGNSGVTITPPPGSGGGIIGG